MNTKFTGDEKIAPPTTKKRFPIAPNGSPAPSCSCCTPRGDIGSMLKYVAMIRAIDEECGEVRGIAGGLELCANAKAYYYATIAMTFITDLTPSSPKPKNEREAMSMPVTPQLLVDQLEMAEVFFDDVREMLKSSHEAIHQLDEKRRKGG